MTIARTLFALMSTACLLLDTSFAQSFGPRSADYMFAVTANDARAIWVNPAGLAVLPEASLMGEFVVQRPVNENMRLSQLTFGFNSQGLSFGYNRERLASDSANHTYRLALARALSTWTLGVAVSHYRSGLNDTGFDFGIRYRLLPSIQLGAVVRNLGQPSVRNDTLPLTGVASVGWTMLPGFLDLTGEAIAIRRLADSGYDMAYRAGASLSLGRAVPVSAIATVNLESDLGVSTMYVGVSVGGLRRGVLVAGVAREDPSLRVQSISLAALATNPLTTWRR